jgi:hypothetical protein
MKTEMVFETSVSTKAEPHYLAENPNDLLQENSLVRRENIKMRIKFKYLGTTLTNENDIHDKIKSRLNSGNACHYSVQNLLSSHLISKNLRLKYTKL